ncbi:MAG: hypothetical protein AUJ92_19130 [Armatimonadetes bacterium CG2_30_59_28]|nr:Ldh family oxidoreductase [Armatimonadota bacterium]OIO90323.1 MAG: hypothetical protein AUJ92_19130 [Armatimonadetes bacterium CG2_30_59_28]PIU63512.1 MAG: hypothetical protein COS85_15900 [Armatimonadetes bacterium CG07_land_8_20_14_0_80_59_28]PIX44525.1 MAG: hypothetical protein COZ56_04385 [Armatimonadetes bacterium CG_4_8_14_3_um_filter_58_9]PIY38596.1 MAG: hypothetical protein COZ05_20560 [Armatimonadetes bacterium CG_4_10_14_3_um_filter_59_10]PJB71890.1 MAG: hypothetical protein CO09
MTGGLVEKDAAIVGDCLIEAELRGRPTHGLLRIPGLIRMNQKAKPLTKSSGRADLRAVVRGKTYALLDANRNLGYLAAQKGMGIAMGLAQNRGAATVGIFNTNHSGMLGYYPLMAARQDLIGIAVCNCSPLMTAHQSIEKIFGTNPIAIGIPGCEFPILLDMSTSAATYGDMIVAIEQGKPLPPGAAVDQCGNPTTDPHEAMEGGLLPFGGHKGHALAFVIQLLAGPLVRADTIPESAKNYGLLMMAIDPAIFRPLEEFKAEATYLLQAMKQLTPVPGSGEILAPGERGERERMRRLREGITVKPDLWEELSAMAAVCT